MNEDQDYFADVTWEKKSLVEQWKNRTETRIRWERRCYIEFGYVPTHAYLPKTPWLLGCVLEMVRGGVGSGIFFIGDLPVYRSAKCDPGTVILSHPLAPMDIVVSGERLMRWPE